MLLAAQIILIIAGVLLLIDAMAMATHRPNPIKVGGKNWPFPCPNTLIWLGVGLILFCIAGIIS
jgi:hypothetical protein